MGNIRKKVFNLRFLILELKTKTENVKNKQQLYAILVLIRIKTSIVFRSEIALDINDSNERRGKPYENSISYVC